MYDLDFLSHQPKSQVQLLNPSKGRTISSLLKQLGYNLLVFLQEGLQKRFLVGYEQYLLIVQS